MGGTVRVWGVVVLYCGQKAGSLIPCKRRVI
jgi:hypothetical protein